ncbi:MAG: FKBP-type peptidyl-prolyl cis-trans isomerase [Sulfuricella sp.]|nr:peptidylprolyl isomerase [Gammaproteobacteria bacterium]
MQVSKNSVVSISFELSDTAGKLLEKSEQPISYLHGGYDGIFPTVEEALEGVAEGGSVAVTLDPENAFGEFDEELVRVEPRDVFPTDEIEVGMQFQAGAEGSDEDMIFTITDITADKVVIDGNHPLAGQTLLFKCTVESVRPASAEEIAHGHAHGEHGHHH